LRNKIQQFFCFNLGLQWVAHLPIIARGGTGSGIPELTPAEFCIFHSDLDPARIWTRSIKFGKNWTRNKGHFSISAVAGDCVVIFQMKTWVN